MLIAGIVLVVVSKILPQKHWQSLKNNVKYEIKAGKKKKIKG
jgi:hypothetical protein